MPIADGLIAELEYEAANTRKVLERCPEDRFGWKPHEKSFSMGALASHIAGCLGWTEAVTKQDQFDYAPPGAEPYKEEQAKTRAELLEKFDQGAAATRAALAGVSDADMMKTWTLLGGGKEVFSMPRIGVLRSMIFNHIVHHRAQLTVYLRLNDIPVPALYGPSADEQA